MIPLLRLLQNTLNILPLLLNRHVGAPESGGNKENDIKEIYNYHLGLKESFQKIVVPPETGLKTKHAAVPTGTEKPPTMLLCTYCATMNTWVAKLTQGCAWATWEKSLTTTMDCKPEIQPCLQGLFSVTTATMILFWYSNYLCMSAMLTTLWSSNKSSYIMYKARSPRVGETKGDTLESRWVSCSPSRCQGVLQVAHSSTICPAEGLCCTYRHSHAPAHHKPTSSHGELHRQQRFTNPNFSLQVKELCKLFLGFICLLLIGQRMLLLPFTPSIHVGKSVLSSYTKRSAHPHGDFFLWRKNVEITLRKVLLHEQQICIKRTITLQEWNL